MEEDKDKVKQSKRINYETANQAFPQALNILKQGEVYSCRVLLVAKSCQIVEFVNSEVGSYDNETAWHFCHFPHNFLPCNNVQWHRYW